MRGPASVWITSDPAAPPVRVDVTDPGDPGFQRSHTFPPGEVLRGSVPTSEGRYHVAGQDGACAIDLVLAPDQEADILITPDASGGCTLTATALHAFDDPRFPHREPAVLIVPGSLPTDEPRATDP